MFWLVCDNGMGVIRTIGVAKALLVAVLVRVVLVVRCMHALSAGTQKHWAAVNNVKQALGAVP